MFLLFSCQTQCSGLSFVAMGLFCAMFLSNLMLGFHFWVLYLNTNTLAMGLCLFCFCRTSNLADRSFDLCIYLFMKESLGGWGGGTGGGG